MTTIPFPHPTDKWCEDTLTPDEGLWQDSGYGITSVSSEAFVEGQKSIKTQGTAYHLRAIFKLKSPLSGLTYPEGKIELYIANTENMSGTGYVQLRDSQMRAVSYNIYVNPASVWESKSIPLANFTGNSSFNWSEITWIYIDMDKGNALMAAFFIDNMHFAFNVPDSTVLLASSPSGKSGTINTSFMPELFGYPADFVTPSTVTLPEGLPITIQMDVEGFSHWADDVENNNPTRSITVPVDDLTLQAVYSVNPNPLLVIDSFNQQMETHSAESAVRITRAGVSSVVRVPFAQRLGVKGLYSLSAIDAFGRSFNHWKLPSGANTTNRTIELDIQSDKRVEVHWDVTGDGAGTPLLLIAGVLGISAGIAFLYLGIRKRK